MMIAGKGAAVRAPAAVSPLPLDDPARVAQPATGADQPVNGAPTRAVGKMTMPTAAGARAAASRVRPPASYQQVGAVVRGP